VSKKNKGGQAAKRRQKKQAAKRKARPLRLACYKLERARRRAKKLAHQLKTLQAAGLMKDGVNVPDITDDEYVFWLCHGANFLASKEDEGLWDPLFEGIYEGRMPDEETVAQTVLDKYAIEIESDEAFTGVPRTVMAWTLTEKPNVRIYKYEAERRLRESDPGCDAAELARQPHNPVVWGLMTEIKQRSLEAAPETGSDQDDT